MNRIPSDLQAFQDFRSLSLADHWIYQSDGKGGRISQPAQFRFLPPHNDQMVFPWGLAQMDNAEIAVVGVACDLTAWKDAPRQTVMAFSRDQGATWSDYHPVEGCTSRPMMLTYLGNGELSFMTSWEAGGNSRWYSADYGRTWPQQVNLDPAPNGSRVDCEGNSLIERDDQGVAVSIAETGQTLATGRHGEARCRGCIRWSLDGGRSWTRFSWPAPWQWQDVHDGRTYERGVGEGALVRAANGSIVAALRTDMPARYLPLRHDNFEGTAISISHDEGETWSPLNFVLGLGRHHATLIRLPNDDLVMTFIRRLELKEGKLVSYRRGCDAVVSHDHGLTWDVDRTYVLDEFSAIYPRPRRHGGKLDMWFGTVCGHQFSIGLDDGSILTTYGNYRNAGALIRWRP